MEDFRNSTLDEEISETSEEELAQYTDFFEAGFETVSHPESELIYISGYAAFKMKHHLKCSACIETFVSAEDTNDKYFREINRGGLSVPSDLLLIVAKLCLFVMQRLIQEDFEPKFIRSPNQKRLMFSLIMKEGFYIVDEIEGVLAHKCDRCEADIEKSFRKVVSIFCNILLNNYSKIKNNNLSSVMDKPKGANPEKMKSNRKVDTYKK